MWFTSTVLKKLTRASVSKFQEINLLSKSESVKFSLIESVICLFTDSSVKKYFSLLNQLISTEIISEFLLIYSNLFLAIWISQISLIISRFWLIQILRVSLCEEYKIEREARYPHRTERDDRIARPRHAQTCERSSKSKFVYIFSTISKILKKNFMYFGHKHVETHNQ